MMTAIRLLRGTGVFFTAAILIVFAMSIGVQGVQPPADARKNLRADIVTIDALKSFGKLERPPVVFLHEKHSDAVEKQNKNCTACHLQDKERRSLKFKRLEDTSRQASMDIYHTECVGCHKEMAAAQKSGPVTCGECHGIRSAWTSPFIIAIPQPWITNVTNVIINMMRAPNPLFTPKAKRPPAGTVMARLPRKIGFPCNWPRTRHASIVINASWRKTKAPDRKNAAVAMRPVNRNSSRW
jgi:hypothetical protein